MRRTCVDVLSMVPAAVLAAAVHSAGDYGSGIADDPAPTIAAIVHGHLSAAAHEQPFMGLTSILLRLPFAAIATALGGGRMLTYRFGVFPCALVLALVVLAVVRRARVQPVVGVLIAVVAVLNPITVEWLNGHPEELLGGALCVGAVLAAMDDRPVLTGVLLGLAVATKEWALLAVLPTSVACTRGRRRMLLIAAVVAAPLVFTLPLVDPTAFTRVSRGIGNLTWPSFRSWWWMVSSYQHVKLAHGLSTSVRLLPLGLTRADVSLLPLLIAVPLTWLHVRRRTRPEDAMRLLALVLLLRCALDPECGPYYTVPALVALLAWEVLDGRVPLAALIGMACFSLGEHEALAAATLGTAQLCWLAGTVGLSAYLLLGELHLLPAARHRPIFVRSQLPGIGLDRILHAAILEMRTGHRSGEREPGVHPPVRSELPVYAMWLAPTILGAVLNWAWWVPFPLLIPGGVLWQRLCRAASTARDPRMPRHLTSTDEIPIAIAGGVVAFVLLLLGTKPYVSLVFVGSYIALLLPLRRAIWRRVDSEERELLDTLDAEATARS